MEHTTPESTGATGATGATGTTGTARSLLILDDDDLVGMLVATVGQLDGLAVRLTARPDAFYAALDAAEPSHIVLDMTLPGCTGEEVLQQLATRGCGARIILASGVDAIRLADAAALAHRLGLDLAGTLPKPFTPAALRALLAAV